jgi:hypothetical protein
MFPQHLIWVRPRPITRSRNEEMSVAFPASVTSRLLAGGAPLRWFTVGLKHDKIHVTEARSCNQEGDHFWRQPENTDLLGPSDCGRENSRQAIGPLSVRWSRRVCKLLNSNCDPTPDSRTSVIAVCCKLRRRAPRLALRAKLRSTPVAIRFGLVRVLVDHQHRDTPDVDLPYHAGKDRRAPISNCLTATKATWALPSLDRMPATRVGIVA